jgi:UDP-2,4-diacetamido-2,4,6-trideoxy-beta-L-altropyranose hydrolase
MSNSPALLIRADGDTTMGTGHVMRCIALAQAWRETGGEVSFALAQHTPALLTRLADEGFSTHTLETAPGSPADAAWTIELTQQTGAMWLAADGYFFDATYQQTIKAAGLPLLLVDDYGHADHYCADIVLNQNISASEEPYSSREPHTRLLLGTRYALLRREFWPWRGWQREIPAVARRLLVTLGGGDPDNVTLTALHALRELDSPEPLNVEVVVGGSNPHLETLHTTARELSHQVEVVQNVSDMPERMARADVAISAGGSTNWELAFLGLPTLAIIVADNQRPIAEALHAQGIVHNLGWYTKLSPATIAQSLTALLPNAARRAEMAQRGQALVDGEGGGRVIEVMKGYC